MGDENPRRTPELGEAKDTVDLLLKAGHTYRAVAKRIGASLSSKVLIRCASSMTYTLGVKVLPKAGRSRYV